MTKDTQLTDVVFRVDNLGIVFAMLPHEVCDFKGNVICYQHVGQHSGADYKHWIKNSRKATENELKPLKFEMENLGYNLKIVTRQNYKLYLESYNKVRKL